MKIIRACAGALPALFAFGCAHGSAAPSAETPSSGSVDARTFLFHDSSGLTVATTVASVNQRVAARTSVFARAVADYIHLQRKQLDPSDPASAQVLTGHMREADVVTSASALPSGGGSTDKWRAEAAFGPSVDTSWRGRPLIFAAVGRISFEPDYRSYSALVRGAIDLFQRNTTVAAFGGFGHDEIIPAIAPPGQSALWPASHHRWTGGLTLAQLLSPRTVLSLGVAGSRQEGQLASPYRRAIVKTTLFPEVVPETRARLTTFVVLSRYLLAGTAVHVRLGGYFDSWGVKAIIAQGAVVKEFGDRWLALLDYRFYDQTAARFYAPVYTAILPTMSGDPRDGQVVAHDAGVAVQWGPFARGAGRTTVAGMGRVDVSVLDYLQIGQRVIAEIASLGLTINY